MEITWCILSRCNRIGCKVKVIHRATLTTRSLCYSTPGLLITYIYIDTVDLNLLWQGPKTGYLMQKERGINKVYAEAK